MDVEVYTPLGNAATLFRNKENQADNILLFHDRDSEICFVKIHICKHDLLELSKIIEKWLASNESQRKQTP